MTRRCPLLRPALWGSMLGSLACTPAPASVPPTTAATPPASPDATATDDPAPEPEPAAAPAAEAGDAAPDAPDAPAPTAASSEADPVAELQAWVGGHRISEGIPAALLPASGKVAVLVQFADCDGKDCTERTDRTAADLQRWLKDFDDVPGWDVSRGAPKCKDGCCTFPNLGREAGRAGGSVPHELLELRAVCITAADDDPPGTIRRLKFIQY